MVKNLREWFDIKTLREKGIDNITVAHTHPVQAIHYAKGLKGDLPSADRVAPPSSTDILYAQRLTWLNRFMESEKWMNALPSMYQAKNAVICAQGFFEYTVDAEHPFQKENNAMIARSVVDDVSTRVILKKYAIPAESLIAVAKEMLAPDPFVQERSLMRLGKIIPKFEDQKIFIETFISYMGDGVRDDDGMVLFQKKQLEIMNATPAERDAKIADFIAWCKNRGIDITYTPFSSDTQRDKN